MTHLCCPSCRLRFTTAAAAYLSTCPVCGQPTRSGANPSQCIGFSLFRPEYLPQGLPEAAAVAIRLPDPREGQ
jgi:hypothetical protein